jgi:acyl-CoA hydrolase
MRVKGLPIAGALCRALLLIALASLVACDRAPDYTPLPDGAVVLAFGDSVTHGTGGGGTSYPTLLAEMTGWRVINAGVPGDTANRARNRIGPLLERHRPDLVIVELGGNDFLRKHPDDQVREDLRSIVMAVRESGAVPALVAVPRFSLLRASAGALSDAGLYEELAAAEAVLLIENVFSDVLSDESLRADPIHPNASGYRVLAEGILDALRSAGLTP